MKKIRFNGKLYLLDAATGRTFEVDSDGKQGAEVKLEGFDPAKADEVKEGDQNPANEVLKQTREEAKKWREQFEALRDSLGGLKPDEIAEIIRKAREQEALAEQSRNEQLAKEGKYKELLEETEKKFKAKITDLEGKLEAANGLFTSERINNTVLSLTSRPDVVNAKQVAALVRDRFKLNETGEVIVVDDHGAPALNGQMQPLSPKEYVDAFFETNTHFLKAGRSGGAGSGGSAPAGNGSIRTKADLKDDTAKAAFIREKGVSAYLELPPGAAA
ncbi:MAG: hypothetical protein P1V51_20150 [Deltaproteobacteria bacterium]|nr:hypothetical protein [Deltaproteobacteria bacterium]